MTRASLAPGVALPAFVDAPLTLTDFARYQGASGDFNPIHHDPEFAHAAGYPGVFAVSMLAAGIVGGRVASWVGAENVRRFGVRSEHLGMAG